MPHGRRPGTIHLNPAAELAKRVLLPGDPRRALTVAQALLERPRMFNHRRGLWGYTGRAADGHDVTVQATGIGGPSAAIVVEELVQLGARVLVRIGTCGALVPELALGEVLAADDVVADDGTSIALGASRHVQPEPALAAALRAAAGRSGRVVSSDVFYDPRPGMPARWRAEGAIAVEMEAAAVFQVAKRHGVAAACLLAVSDALPPSGDGGGRRRIPPEALEAAGVRLGQVALDALAREL